MLVLITPTLAELNNNILGKNIIIQFCQYWCNKNERTCYICGLVTMIALLVKLDLNITYNRHSIAAVPQTYLVPPSTLWGGGGGGGGGSTPGNPSTAASPRLPDGNIPMHLPPGSLSSHGHYSNVDSVLIPLSPPQATHDGLPLHERYPMAHDLFLTIHPSLQ